MNNGELRAVLVGCGAMARAWTDAAKAIPGLTVAGLVDINRAAAEKFADANGYSKEIVFDSLTAALGRVKPQIVFDVTVPDAHEKVTVEALLAGCHVLGEKPLSDSLASARRMIAAAREAGKTYAVIQNQRYEPNIQRVQRTLGSGAIGEISDFSADFFIGPHFGGFRDAMAHPLLGDMAIHTFDAARFISGRDPVAVYCHARNPKHSWYAGKAAAVAIFEMTGDVVFSYRGNWVAEGLPTSWNSAWRVVGSKGTLTWDGAADIKAQAVKPDGKHAFWSEVHDVAVPAVTVEHQGHAGLIREFVDCVRGGGRPQTICDDNVKSLAMVLAAVESAESGKRVEVKW